MLGEALDRDPFLLFELRGKRKEQVLDALRAARGGGREAVPRRGGEGKAPVPAPPEMPTMKLGEVKAADYDRPRQALPALHFMFDAPVMHGAVVRQLGAPAGWDRDTSPADVLVPMVRAAADTARRLALAEPIEANEAASPTAKKTAPKRARRGARA